MKTFIGLATLLAFIGIATTASGLVSSVFTSKTGVASGVCPEGQSQDYSCLENQGAIASDGNVDNKIAAIARDKGACPCMEGSGSVTSMTIPGDDGSSFEAFANQQASAVWGYNSVILKAYSINGTFIQAKTISPGKGGSGFSALKQQIKLFLQASRKSGAHSIKSVTGSARI